MLVFSVFFSAISGFPFLVLLGFALLVSFLCIPPTFLFFNFIYFGAQYSLLFCVVCLFVVF